MCKSDLHSDFQESRSFSKKQSKWPKMAIITLTPKADTKEIGMPEQRLNFASGLKNLRCDVGRAYYFAWKVDLRIDLYPS
jgi:hypothetical protein